MEMLRIQWDRYFWIFPNGEWNLPFNNTKNDCVAFDLFIKTLTPQARFARTGSYAHSPLVGFTSCLFAATPAVDKTPRIQWPRDSSIIAIHANIEIIWFIAHSRMANTNGSICIARIVRAYKVIPRWVSNVIRQKLCGRIFWGCLGKLWITLINDLRRFGGGIKKPLVSFRD